MNVLITCFIIAAAQLSVHYWLRKDIKKLQKFNLRNYVFNVENKNLDQSVNYHNRPIQEDNLNFDRTGSEMMILKMGLNHLEFITEFETYLEAKNYENFPLDLMRELEKLKIKTQTSILKTTNDLKGDFNEAA